MSSWFQQAKLRAHEWAADRFSFVQYPHIRPIGQAQQVARRPMSAGEYLTRLAAGIFGLLFLLAAGVLLLGALWIFWLVFVGLTT